jgi:hypothetical protein
VKKDLKELTKFVIDQKTLSFKESEVSFNCDDLITNEVLERQPNQIKVGNSLLFTKAFFEHFANKLNFTLTNDFQALVEFYHKVQKEFKVESKVIMGLTEQMRNLLIYLIKRISNEFGVTFEDFVLSLKKDDENRFLYKFNSSFFKCLNELNLEAENLYPIVIHINNQLADPSVGYSKDLGELTIAVESFCMQYPDKGVNLLKLHQEKESEPIINIHSAILAGLYKSNRAEELERIKDLAQHEINHISIACAISAIEPESSSEAANLLDTIESIKSVANDYVIYLPRLYVNIINNENVSDAEILKKCFAKLQQLLEFEPIGIKQNTLWQLLFVKGHDEEVFKIINSLNKAPLEENLYKVLNHGLTKFEDQRYFFQFLRGYSVNNKMKFEPNKFDFPIRKFKNDNPSVLGKHLIELLIDNNGGIRFIGKRILSHLRIVVYGNYQFENDILKLSALEQYKLLVSVFQDSPEPKDSLPLLLPLRKSKFPFVAEALICKMELLIESYTSSVISVLREHLDLADNNDKQLLARIELKYGEFGKYWDKKVKVKELNPLYTQSKLYEIYQEGFGDSLSSNLEDSVEDKSSFLSLFTPVTLAKGGGWKHEKGGQVSQLSSIGTSFQFPREYYIRPETFDFENRVSYTENWENEFKKWEVAISSLGNT